MTLVRALTKPLVKSITQGLVYSVEEEAPEAPAGAVAHYKYNTGITVTGSGVSQWADQSGNGNHLLQATDASRPAKQPDGAILFNGTSHVLKTAAFTLPSPFTFYFLMKPITWANGFAIADGNTNFAALVWQWNVTPEISLYAGTAPNGVAMPLGVYGVLTTVFNGASSFIGVDGVGITIDPGAATGGGFTLGARGDAAASFTNIEVMEVLIYPSAHNEAERTEVITYLQS